MKKLLLVGGGHAHLHVVKQLQRNPIKGVEVTLISASKYQYYSGMFSGYTEGLYTKEDIRINSEKLAQNSNVSWKEDVVTAVDAEQKMLLTASGEIHRFDIISFDIGSLTAGIDTLGVADNALRIKPNYHYVDVIEQARESEKICVVGGGAAGIEISLSLSEWRKKQQIQSPVTLISNTRLLEQKDASVSAKIENIVTTSGINLLTNETVTSVHPNYYMTSTGKKEAYDNIIWLTGPKAHGLFKSSNLPTNEDGYLLVEDTLQVKKHPFMFGAGDCITLRDYPTIDKAGVYAVKQGKVLYKNLLAFIYGTDGERYIPQKDYLSILSIGNKEGFLLFKDFAFKGKWTWYVKNKIDTTFINNYKNIY
jgi:NADH dehydrogenase FAD-containing subunit